jgi:peroxiredoxin Q/BCP
MKTKSTKPKKTTSRSSAGATPKTASGGPKVDAPAPAFTLTSDAGESVSLKDYKGKWVVLYFYPKDHTPGCTREAIAFEGATAALRRKGAVVLGVSRDSVATHCSFKEKQGLHFPLLSDPTSEVHKLYGAYGDKLMYGRKVTGALRTTALIRPDGTVGRLFTSVKVDGHADAVLAEIDAQARG